MNTIQKLMTLLLTVIPSMVWLIYWTGRWYKEWYFNKFSINYSILDFNKAYYLHGSWATIWVAISILIVVLNFIFAFLFKSPWFFRAIFILSITALFYFIFFQRFQFDPYGSFFRKLIGSNDLCIIILGILNFALFLLLIYFSQKEFNYFYRAFFSPLFKDVTICLITIISIVLILWLYLAFVGYFMGNYHGRKAIWEGKMGLNWIKYDNMWWIHVVRTEDGRNFLYDRDKIVVKHINDDKIEEVNGHVTREQKR